MTQPSMYADEDPELSVKVVPVEPPLNGDPVPKSRWRGPRNLPKPNTRKKRRQQQRRSRRANR